MATFAAPASGPVRERTTTRSVRAGRLTPYAGLALLALFMCVSHIAHGGFYFDDWSLLELARFPPADGLLHGLFVDYGQRPGQALYYAALSEAFGSSASPRLALAAAGCALEAGCLYALLRGLGLRVLDAFAIAALALAFPFSDSVWLWDVLSLASLSIAAGLLGVILALRALHSRGARAVALHGVSLALYLASVLSYEVFAVAGCLAGLLYIRAAGWRRARARWALDVLFISASLAFARGVLPIDVATPSRLQSLSGMVAHAGLIVRDGIRLAGKATLPIEGVSSWIGAALLAAVLVGALALRTKSSPNESLRRELGRWLQVAAVGLLVAGAAWAVYVPAPDHYSPVAGGTVNRINVLAAIGIATLVYSCISLVARMLASLVGSRTPVGLSAGSSPVLVSLCAVAAVLALVGAYLARDASDARAWDTAAADQRALIAGLRSTLERLPRAATVYVLDAPATVGQGVPVLDTPLDLTSAIRVSYGDPTLIGVPLGSAVPLTCGSRGPSAGGYMGVYGRSFVVDLPAHTALRLSGPASCAWAVERR